MFHQLLLPFVFSRLSAAAHNVSRFRVVLGAEFYRYTTALSPKLSAPPPAPPRRRAAAATAVGVYTA